MTTWPRLLLAPALLVGLAIVVLGGVAVARPADRALVALLVVAVVLLVLASLLAGLSVGSVLAGRREVDDVVSSQSRLLADVFSFETATVLLTTDVAGAITRVNVGAETVLGRPERALVGSTPEVFLDEAELATWALAMRIEPTFAAVAHGLVANEQQQPLDWPYLRPDGERRLLSMTISEFGDEHGDVTGFLIAGRDVTDQARGIDLGTDQFVASVSHELRTPMASILGYAEMLQEELADQPESAALRDFVERIDRNGNRMLTLIQNLLTLTRVEAADLQLQPEEVDLRALVSSAYDDLKAGLADRQLDLSLRLPPESVVHQADPRLVADAVSHLLANAAKFTPDGGRVVVSLRTNGKTSRIVVSDTGLGIAQTDQEQLFDRFFRSHQPEVQQAPGSGLGLAIVRASVVAHGGSVTFDSELGRGSTFIIELPVRLPSSITAGLAVAPPSMSA
ncbi:sensor histidine kinase [Nocardioides sp.]|uniref:sensor histidine kinase n=1 Tax=Nocardioides sp. TaxID=35761 RepID=UPI002ED0E41F